MIKLFMQYNLNNKNQTIGLNYLFLVFTICWAICEAIYKVSIENGDIVEKVTIGVFATVVAWICVALYAQRRENLKIMNESLKH